jgi:hypothetical protein
MLPDVDHGRLVSMFRAHFSLECKERNEAPGLCLQLSEQPGQRLAPVTVR